MSGCSSSPPDARCSLPCACIWASARPEHANKQSLSVSVCLCLSYLVEKLGRLDFGKEGEVDDGHLPGHLLRVKVKDSEQRRRVGGNLEERRCGEGQRTKTWSTKSCYGQLKGHLLKINTKHRGLLFKVSTSMITFTGGGGSRNILRFFLCITPYRNAAFVAWFKGQGRVLSP